MCLLTKLRKKEGKMSIRIYNYSREDSDDVIRSILTEGKVQEGVVFKESNDNEFYYRVDLEDKEVKYFEIKNKIKKYVNKLLWNCDVMSNRTRLRGNFYYENGLYCGYNVILKKSSSDEFSYKLIAYTTSIEGVK